MPDYVVSDLHLGSPYCHLDNFLSWLDQLPAGARLVLNGDIIDDPREPLPPSHEAVVQRLVDESRQRPVVWVFGNHDRSFVLADKGEIEFVPTWQLDGRLLVTHGDSLDEVMPRHSIFKSLFKALHRLLIWCGFPDVHVAMYAKKWPFFYRVLNDHVATKAVKLARGKGYEAITCGHTHAAMDIQRDGVRYLNTGAWTEAPHYFLKIDPDQIHFCTYNGNGSVPA